MILRSELENLQAERSGKSLLSTNSMFANYVPQSVAVSGVSTSGYQLPSTLGSYSGEIGSVLSKYQPQKTTNFTGITTSAELGQEVGGVGRALGYSALTGVAEYTQNFTDWVLSQTQMAKKGFQSSMEQITKKSTDPERQLILDTYTNMKSSAKTLSEKQAANRYLADTLGNLDRRTEFKIKADSEYDAGTPVLTEARKKVEQYFKPKVNKLSMLADVENESWAIQKIAGGIASLPYSAAARSRVLGFFMNYGVFETQSIRQKISQMQSQGIEITPEIEDQIRIYASGAALIEAGTEAIFPAGGTSAQLALSSVKGLAKFIMAQGGQEAVEEILSGIGQGILAKFTTDTSASLLGIKEGDSLITLEGLAGAAFGGFVMGSVMSGVTGTAGFVNTKAVTNKYKDAKVGDIGTAETIELESAMKEDGENPDNYEEIKDQIADSVVEMSQNPAVDTTIKPEQETTTETLTNNYVPQSAQTVTETPTTAQTDFVNIKNMAQGIKDGAIDSIWNSVQTGKWAIEPTKAGYFEQTVNILNEKGLIKSRTDVERIYNVFSSEGSTKEVTTKILNEYTTQPITEKTQKTTQGIMSTIASIPDATSDETLGIVAKGYEGRVEADYEINGIDDDVKESMRKTSNFAKQNASLKDIVKDAYNYVRKNVALGSVTVANKYGDYKRAIRSFREAGNKASARTVEMIKKSYGSVRGKQRALLQKAILFYDFEENINRGIPFLPRHGVKTVDQLYKITDSIRTEMAKSENKAVQDAYDNRKKMNSAALDELISMGNKVGKDYSYMKSREYYVYNKIYEQYVAEKTNINKQGIKFYQRKGSAHDYVSNPIVLDFLSMTKVFKMIGRLDVLSEVIALDKTKEVKYDKKTGQEILPEGYIRVNKNEIVGNLEITNDIEKHAHETAIRVMQSEGINPDSSVGKKILKKANFLDLKSSIVIPIEVYDNVVDEFIKKESNRGAKAIRELVKLWKWTKIRSPFVVWKYNTRNMIGDMEFVSVVKPSVLLKIPKATRALLQYFYRGNRENEMVMNHMDKTGAMTGISVREMGDVVEKVDPDALTTDATRGQNLKAIGKKIWGALTAKKFTQFREQILRYATYNKLTEETIAKLKTVGIDVLSTTKVDSMRKAGQPLVSANGNKIISFSDYVQMDDSVFGKEYQPKSYLVSSRDEINSIKKLDDKNVKLSEDLMGAYNDVSPFGVAMADHAMPFFRFTEISIKRYVRLIENSFYSEGATINSEGRSVAQKAGVAAKIGAVGVLKLGKYAIRLALFYAAIAASNVLFAGDDEDKLPEDVKKQPHITVPSWITGDKERVYYISNIGVASGFLNALGFRVDPQDILAVATGDKTLEDVAKEMSDPVNVWRLVFSINPLMVQSYELATGKKGYFFDPENPTQIRDRLQYMFEQAGFAPIYNIFAGKPISVATTWGTALANNVAEGDVAMWAVYDMLEDFYKENNIEPYNFGGYKRGSPKWKKANAAYYYKMALKLNDVQAMERYLAEYVALGGTSKTLADSFQTMEPAHFLEKKYKKAFAEQLTEEEKETFNRAMDYYRELQALKEEDVIRQLSGK